MRPRCCDRFHASGICASTSTPSNSTRWPTSSRESRRPTPSRSPEPRHSATPTRRRSENHNGGNMSAVVNVMEISWGDVALMLSIPRQGLGNAAISGVATDEQLERLGKGVWAAMAITEPGFGSDSAAVSTTAKRRRRRVRHQRREDLRHRRIAGHPHRGVGDAGQVEGPRRDQVVHRAARIPGGHRRAARGQARHQGLRHRGDPVRQRPHPEGQPARQPGDRRGEGASPG